MQFSLIMNQLVQLAIASGGGNLSSASTVDTPPQLLLNLTADISLMSPPIPPTYRAKPPLQHIPTTCYPPNSLLTAVLATTQLLSSTSSHTPASHKLLAKFYSAICTSTASGVSIAVFLCAIIHLANKQKESV